MVCLTATAAAPSCSATATYPSRVRTIALLAPHRTSLKIARKNVSASCPLCLHAGPAVDVFAFAVCSPSRAHAAPSDAAAVACCSGFCSARASTRTRTLLQPSDCGAACLAMRRDGTLGARCVAMRR